MRLQRRWTPAFAGVTTFYGGVRFEGLLVVIGVQA